MKNYADLVCGRGGKKNVVGIKNGYELSSVSIKHIIIPSKTLTMLHSCFLRLEVVLPHKDSCHPNCVKKSFKQLPAASLPPIAQVRNQGLSEARCPGS